VKYFESSLSASFGQASTQAPQAMHCILFMDQFFSARVTVIAAVGHLRWQRPQNMHVEVSITTWPREPAGNSRNPNGNFSVTGFEKRFLTSVFNITKKRMIIFLYN
jgi:hypothetical protein